MTRSKASKSVPPIPTEEAVLRSYFHLEPIVEHYLYHDDISFSVDGTLFAVTCGSKDIRIFKTDGHSEQTNIQNHKYQCTKCCWHASSQSLYVNSKHATDHSARQIKIEDKSFIRYFHGHSAQITSLCPTPTGLITASEDCTVKIWDEHQSACLSTLNVESPCNIAMHPNGICLAVCSQTRLELFDMRNLQAGSATEARLGYDTEIFPRFGMRGKYMALVGKGIVTEYALADLSVPISVESVCKEKVPGFCFAPNESYLLVATQENVIAAVDTEKGSLMTVLTGHDEPITAIAHSPSYHHVVSAANNCLFWTVDIPTYNALVAARAPKAGTLTATLTADAEAPHCGTR